MKRMSAAVAVALLALGVVGATPAIARHPDCKIVNQSTDAKYENLQSALDEVSSGETIIVKGYCVGAAGPPFDSGDFTIRGKSNPSWGPATLDGDEAFQTLDLRGERTVSIDSVTITGATGRGLYVDDEAVAVVTNSLITGNTGAGIFVDEQGSLRLESSIVSYNEASGIRLDEDSFDTTIIGSTISHNTSSASGGGIYADSDSPLSIIASTITNNMAEGVGGGLYAGGGQVTVDDTVIARNSASGGGGVWLSIRPDRITATSVSLFDNSPDDCDSGFVDACETVFGDATP